MEFQEGVQFLEMDILNRRIRTISGKAHKINPLENGLTLETSLEISHQ